MFKAELSNNSIFKDCFESISKIVDEIVLECDEEGMRIKTLDRSHITFVHLELNNSLFDSYICDVPEKISIDSVEFMKVLKRCKSNDLLCLTVEDGNFVIKFVGDSTRTFNIRLIDLEYESAQPPVLEPPVNLELPTDVLKDTLADIELFSEKIRILADPDKVSFTGDGEFGDTCSEYVHGQVVSDSVSSMFSLDKLKDMMKAEKLSNVVDIGLGQDMPLLMKFEIGMDDGELGFLLAPRLEEEE